MGSAAAPGSTARRLRERFADWVTRGQSPAERELRLHRRRIYILPTREGWLFAALLLIMLLGATNYSNSMAFMLTFLLAGLGTNAMWHTHRNLLGLEVIRGEAAPVFSGQEARFPLVLRNPTDRPRAALALQWGDAPPALVDVPARGHARAELVVPTRARGLLRPGRFRLYSRYPLGLFQAWSWLEFDMAALVYPRPLDAGRPLPRGAAAAGPAQGAGSGAEDYSGLRAYRPGDAPRHIAWKALARSDQLLTKDFSGGGRQELWLDWEAVEEPDPERRLSVLCHWVLAAEASGLRYGLRLPGTELAPGSGELHRGRCLRRLALFPQRGGGQ